MKKIVFGIAAAAVGIALAGPSLAAKPGAPTAGKATTKAPRVWVQQVTMAFDHKLPNTWSQLEKDRPDASNPGVGSWRYASANGWSKMFIRVSELKEGGIKAAFERALPLLKKRVDQLKEVARTVIPAGPGGNPSGIVFFTGNTAVKNRETKAVEGRAHLIARFFKQYPKAQRQVAITYMFAAGKEDQMQKFMQEQMASFSLHDPVLVAKELIKAAKEDPRPVVKPVAPPAAKLKAALKALGKGGEALVKSSSKALPK